MILRFTFIFLFLFSFGKTVFSQNNIDLNSLPAVEDIMVVRSNPSADTVIIGVHGGPTPSLMQGDFEFFENISTFSVVEIKQQQHLHPEIMANSALTLEQAVAIDDTTVAMLRKVVNHFKAENKEVVLIGHSLGAFFLPEYLDDYGIEDIHRIIPMSGRMNMNQEVVNAFAEGRPAMFENGITVKIDEQSSAEEFAGMKLQAALGMNRFVDSLASMDLSKLMYVYGTHDVAVGRLLPEETSMLENNNATILKIENGSHDAPFEIVNITKVLEFIRTKQTAEIEDSKEIFADVRIYPTVTKTHITVDAKEIGKLRILSINGKVVHQENYSIGKSKVLVDHLNAGMYVAQYITNSNKIKIQKILVQ